MSGWSHKPHIGSGDCFANRLSVSRVVLLPFEVIVAIASRAANIATAIWDLVCRSWQPHCPSCPTRTLALPLGAPTARHDLGSDQIGRDESKGTLRMPPPTGPKQNFYGPSP